VWWCLGYMLRYHLSVFAYCISCATLHQLLTVHYVGHCNSWLSFAETGYCSIIRKTLGALRTSPLLLAGAVIAGAPRNLVQYAAGRQDREIDE
jgi:hypothetical protein